MRNNQGRQIERLVFGGGFPATMVLLTANIVTFLAAFFMMKSGPGGPFWWLAFGTETWPRLPWTIVTWPLVAPLDLIGLLFGGLWMYWVGGSLERAWGTRTYLGFLAVTAALSGLTLYLAGKAFGAPVWVQGLWLATAPLTVAWCAINRREIIRLYGIIPLTAPVLAWLTVGLTWFYYSVGAQNPFFGLFALSGCAAAYWYVTGGRSTLAQIGVGTGRDPIIRRAAERVAEREGVRSQTGFNPLRRWKERQERKRLEALFRRSGLDDK